MQNRLKSFIGYSVRATDGELGKVDEFYFDDLTWTIRYMVVETGSWLSSRKVLISIAALCKPEWETRTFPVNLTCDQVRKSPEIDTQRPVYRQHEAELHEYYRWPQYWEGGYGGILGITPYPVFENSLPREPADENRDDDPHLRSTHQVSGYHIHAADGAIGHVEDFIVDDETWELRHLVVDIGNWLTGRKVLISSKWIKSVDWGQSSVLIDRSRESVKNSPDFEISESRYRDYVENKQ
jgi:sporulation protein YlmC with PRC-barrel domain